MTYTTPKPARKTRPYRSLGLSLAIIGAFALYGVFAVLPAFLVVLLRLQGRVFEPRNVAFWAVPLLAILVMIMCVFVWRGRPRRVRIIFIVLVVLAAVVNAVTAFRPDLLNFVSDGAGGVVIGSSFEPIFAGYLRCLLVPRLIWAVFVVWYCRRAVVRAYFGD